jgi:hypothetical protein
MPGSTSWFGPRVWEGPGDDLRFRNVPHETANYERALDALVAVVDEGLEAVRSTPLEPAIEDEAQSFLVSSYGRAYRCMSAIRALAARPRCDADDALVLTRTLASITAVSLWVVQPEHLADRRYRILQWKHKWAVERLRTQERLVEVGSPIGPAALEQSRRWVEKYKEVVEAIPDDRRLLQDLGLPVLYAKVHRLGSDVTHYSFGSAAGGFTEAITPDVLEGRSVALEHPQPAEAVEVLAYATITYGVFLSGSDDVISHGHSSLAHERYGAWWDEYGAVLR